MFSSFRPHVRLTLGALALRAGAMPLAGALPASADTLGAFTCTDRSGGAASAAATVTAIRIAHHDGYDRLVIDFANAMPQYQLTRQTTSTFIRDASGQPVTLQGSAGIRVVLRNSDIASAVPNDVKPNLPEIREVTQIGNFERVVSYGVGLSTPACFRVLGPSAPPRLVTDSQPPGAPPTATTVPSATVVPSTAASQPATPSD